jgi:hypothetical protein
VDQEGLMEAQVRGQVLLGFLNTLSRVWGAQTHDAVLNRIDPKIKARLNGYEVVPSGWYPMQWFVALHEALHAQCGPGSSAKLGRESSTASVNAVFKFVLSVLSPAMVVGQAARIWKSLFQGVELVLEITEPKRVVARVGPVLAGNAFVWEDWLESMATYLELAGAANVRKQALGGGGAGDIHLRFEMTWD